MEKCVFERHFNSDDRKNAVLSPLIDCYVTSRIVSREPNTHSGSFNNAEQFSIDVSFNTFYSITKNR